MRLKIGTSITVNGKRYVVTGQRGGFVACVPEGQKPDDFNYCAFSVASLVRDAQARAAAAARRREIEVSWELAPPA
jgi:hypothetical protein